MLKFKKINEDKALDKIKYMQHKAVHKDFEAVFVGTLIHQALSLKLNYNTQQPVLMPDGKLYLIDIYFPGINLAVECDEAHHLTQVDADEVREKDIINLTESDFMRVNAHDTAEQFKTDLDNVILEMQKRKADYNGFKIADYDYENEESAMQYLKRYLIENNVSSKFENDKIRGGRYADAICLEHGHFPIDEIDIVLYSTSYLIAIKYDAQFDELIKNNLDIFRSIPNVTNIKYAKMPYVLRFSVDPKYFYINNDRAIDQAVNVALEAKNRLINFINKEN